MVSTNYVSISQYMSTFSLKMCVTLKIKVKKKTTIEQRSIKQTRHKTEACLSMPFVSFRHLFSFNFYLSFLHTLHLSSLSFPSFALCLFTSFSSRFLFPQPSCARIFLFVHCTLLLYALFSFFLFPSLLHTLRLSSLSSLTASPFTLFYFRFTSA